MTQKLGTKFGTEKWNRKMEQKMAQENRTEHKMVQNSDCGGGSSMYLGRNQRSKSKKIKKISTLFFWLLNVSNNKMTHVLRNLQT